MSLNDLQSCRKLLSRRGFIGSFAACSAVSALSGLVGCAGSKGGGAGAVRVVHLGDPQFGFMRPFDTEESYAACRRRFLAMVERVNALHPDLVVVSGDMCNRAADLERDWPAILRRFDVPVAFTPGNHDLGNSVTAQNLSRFRKVFGRDRDAFEIRGWYFIVGNSQFWHPTDLASERDAYECWVSARLDEAKDYGGRVVGVTHIPPFDQAADEPDSYNNCPSADRARRLTRYRESGLGLYLAGHTHRFANRTVAGLTILNPETTCYNFDDRPFGGRLLTLNSDRSWAYDFIPN